MANVSIRQVAERCGVAVSTVSRAMNNRSDVSPETRAKILAAARELNYVPNANARDLKIAESQTIAVIIQGNTSEVLIKILGELQGHLAELGFDTFLQHVPDADANFATLSQIVQERKPAGVIFLGRFGDARDGTGSDVAAQLDDFPVPVVFCTTADFSSPQPRHSSVSVDDVGGARALTQHLIERGHTRIAFALAAHHPHAFEVGYAWALRYKGYREALEQAGIAFDPALLVPSADPIEVYSAPNGYESVRAWLAGGAPEFTALVTSCDAVGLGALRALREAGIPVPEQAEVTSFDGLDFAAYASPSLTTVVQPVAEIAEATAKVIVDAITNPEHQVQQKWIDGTIRLGESTSRER